MEIDIDDVTPTNITLQTHSPESSTSYLAQGSVATRLTWKRMVEESLDDFRRELNGGGMKDDSVVMIRDMERGRNMMLFGDTVVKYEGCQVEDVPMHMLADELARKSKFVFRPNVPWPLIAWSTNDSGTQLTVKMENEIRLFKDPVLNINKPVRLFLPPLWVHVTLDTGNIPTYMRLAIVMDEEDTVETTPIYRLPLPNVYADGRICFGQVVSSLPLSTTPSIKESVAWEYRRWAGSESNADLMDSYNGVPDSEYSALPDDVRKQFDALISRSSDSRYRDLYKLLAMWTQPTGWTKCRYTEIRGGDKEKYLCGSH